MKKNRLLTTSSLIALLTVLTAGANAATLHVKAVLKGSDEVPATDSKGTGTLTGTIDTSTNEFQYHIEYSGLTGPVVAAHFHGPAAAGAKGKPQVPVKGSPIASPIEGKAILTPEQVKDLEEGKWYFNLHTEANPGGEVRGQIEKAE